MKAPICMLFAFILSLTVSDCSKKNSASRPTASFNFTLTNAGKLPTTVNFISTSMGGTSFTWRFGDGNTGSGINANYTYAHAGTYNVTLIVTGDGGVDSTTQAVAITLNPPVASFSFSVLNPTHTPLKIAISNTSSQANTYAWDFGDGDTSTQVNPTHTYTAGGIYTISLTATNVAGSTKATQQVYVTPYPIQYTDFNGDVLNLYAWEGKKVAILSRNLNLNGNTMAAWLTTLDSVYNYYKRCTGREPGAAKIVDNLMTVADVPSTCGAGCGYLGATGVEMQNTYFDVMYNGINANNQYDQEDFYEFGRNFWFYGDQLAYKDNDPVATGYAILMRFRSLDATGVQGGPFNGTMPYPQFEGAVQILVDQYVSNTSLNWNNTLAANTGVPGGFGGATDLFASFCMRLARDYGGDNFISTVWKFAGQRPAATTTQDAVDNFILAACAAANKNLTTLFTVQWRWPMSAAAQTAAAKYN